MMDFRWHFLVVTRGNPSDKSKRIWWPKTLRVPVPVRSSLVAPFSRTWLINFRYCFMLIIWVIHLSGGRAQEFASTINLRWADCWRRSLRKWRISAERKPCL